MADTTNHSEPTPEAQELNVLLERLCKAAARGFREADRGTDEGLADALAEVAATRSEIHALFYFASRAVPASGTDGQGDGR